MGESLRQVLLAYRPGRAAEEQGNVLNRERFTERPAVEQLACRSGVRAILRAGVRFPLPSPNCPKAQCFCAFLVSEKVRLVRIRTPMKSPSAIPLHGDPSAYAAACVQTSETIREAFPISMQGRRGVFPEAPIR